MPSGPGAGASPGREGRAPLRSARRGMVIMGEYTGECRGCGGPLTGCKPEENFGYCSRECKEDSEQAARSAGMDAESMAAKTREQEARGLVPGRWVRRLDEEGEAEPGPWYVMQIIDYTVVLTDTRIGAGGNLHTVKTGWWMVEPMSADEGASL